MDTTVLSDTDLLEWLRDHLEWDGRGYWLPERCVRRQEFNQEFCPEPTMDEFRQILSGFVTDSNGEML